MDHVKSLEQQELIQKLIDNGYSELVDVLLENHCYTRKGRINKSSACRNLSWKNKQLEEAFAACRKILEKDIDE